MDIGEVIFALLTSGVVILEITSYGVSSQMVLCWFREMVGSRLVDEVSRLREERVRTQRIVADGFKSKQH